MSSGTAALPSLPARLEAKQPQLKALLLFLNYWAFTGRGFPIHCTPVCAVVDQFPGEELVSVSSCGFVDTWCPPPKDGGGEKLVVGGYFVVLNDTVVVLGGGGGGLGLFRNVHCTT